MSAKTWHNKILIVNNDYVYRQVSGSHFEQRAINRLSGSAVALFASPVSSFAVSHHQSCFVAIDRVQNVPSADEEKGGGEQAEAERADGDHRRPVVGGAGLLPDGAGQVAGLHAQLSLDGAPHFLQVTAPKPLAHCRLVHESTGAGFTTLR